MAYGLNMGLPVSAQLKYWGIATAILFGALWFLGDILMPFLLGGAVAYFLDPVADRLERLGLSRLLATVCITVSVILVFIVFAFLVIPTLVQQAVTLFDTAPRLVRELQEFLTTQFPSLVDSESTLRKSLLAGLRHALALAENIVDPHTQAISGHSPCRYANLPTST